MIEDNYCPIPKEQVPIQEYIEISNSFFFSWPLNGPKTLYIKLLTTWIISTLIFIFIGTGSSHLQKHPLELLSTSLIFSIFVPLAFLARLYMGWSYINQRLIAKIVEYEESDWHDGQSWKKTEDVYIKDQLVSEFEVMPTLKLIRNGIKYGIIILVLGLAYFIY